MASYGWPNAALVKADALSLFAAELCAHLLPHFVDGIAVVVLGMLGPQLSTKHTVAAPSVTQDLDSVVLLDLERQGALVLAHIQMGQLAFAAAALEMSLFPNWINSHELVTNATWTICLRLSALDQQGSLRACKVGHHKHDVFVWVFGQRPNKSLQPFLS